MQLSLEADNAHHFTTKLQKRMSILQTFIIHAFWLELRFDVKDKPMHFFENLADSLKSA